ncbi:MAG: aldehyde dehydrogenase family protein, partial [Pseudomonadota bacterium]
MTHPVLEQLGLGADNAGSWVGGTPLADAGAGSIASINPTTGETIAHVGVSSAEDYERIVSAAREAFAIWRTVPAPARGEAVRRMGNALRDNLDALGSLVSLENGKIKAEGVGEVQEMIDIADFAVGQSRMMYGKTMHSERP